MSMGYIVYREDLADEAAIQYMVDNNPEMYPMGTAIQASDGTAWIIESNDGTTVVMGLINGTSETGIPEPIDDGITYGREYQKWNPVYTIAQIDDISQWSVDGNNIYNENTGNVGIGDPIPLAKLTIGGGGVVVDPLATDGDKGLGTINVSGNYYVNGVPISGFIDAPSDGTVYGRKDALWFSLGAGAGTVSDLAAAPTANQVTITNTGGNNAIIPEATESIAGVMTALQVQQLATLVIGGGMQPPPIEIHGISTSAGSDLFESVKKWTENLTTQMPGRDEYFDVFSVTGRGVVSFLGIQIGSAAGGVVTDMRLLVDGVEVWQQDSTLSVEGGGKYIIGNANSSIEPSQSGGLDTVSFNSSIALQVDVNLTPAEFTTYFKYQKFSL
jgi:hypothetical protein